MRDLGHPAMFEQTMLGVVHHELLTFKNVEVILADMDAVSKRQSKGQTLVEFNGIEAETERKEDNDSRNERDIWIDR